MSRQKPGSADSTERRRTLTWCFSKKSRKLQPASFSLCTALSQICRIEVESCQVTKVSLQLVHERPQVDMKFLDSVRHRTRPCTLDFRANYGAHCKSLWQHLTKLPIQERREQVGGICL